MKPKALTAILFIVLLCTACNENKEYAYNEFVTDLFVREMNQVDGAQKTFSDSTLIFTSDPSTSIRLSAIAGNIANGAKSNLVSLDVMKSSNKDAAEFRNAVATYFKEIERYGKSATELLDEKNIAKKHTLYKALDTQYQILNRMPDSVLLVQKQYLKKVGLSPKE
ncbi:hypothetical protein DBR11_21715 [Pedobacter sp. HMWF019]|uniref:hypothetical protein n=1 Tax=Pedobacter sp. HMWF019 TaxID=2056856 RepID=UPI000D3B0561|nr:hypothetical protein [Pedobacter sp. HMWF019]PTS95217.1 hypothetical protein DBR11_21715 [Pedobacter sp. HMWF019]